MTANQINDIRERLSALAECCNEQIIQIRTCDSPSPQSSQLVFEAIRAELDTIVREIQLPAPPQQLSIIENARLDGFPI